MQTELHSPEVFDELDTLTETLFADLEVHIHHDPGYMYDRNGDGCPPSTDAEVIPCERQLLVEDIMDLDIDEQVFEDVEVTTYNGRCLDEPQEITVVATIVAIQKRPDATSNYVTFAFEAVVR